MVTKDYCYTLQSGNGNLQTTTKRQGFMRFGIEVLRGTLERKKSERHGIYVFRVK